MKINQLVWQHGGLAALISVILSLVAYIIGVEALVGWPLGVAQSLLIIITMIVVSRAIRSDESGIINFSRLLGHIMISVVCILVSSIVFNVVLFNLIDPELIDTVADITLERVEGMMESFGLEGDLLEQTLSDTELEIRKGYTLSGAFVGLIYGSAFWGLIALIIAAIFKRSPENKINF
jgi:small-conductance mechanosensitive channel